MPKLLERNQEIARRCKDLSPLREPIRARLLAGNSAVIMAGVSPGSTRKVAPLAPSTLARRKGTGPPRAPMGTGSRIIAGCQVDVIAGPQKLSFTKSYPSLGEVAVFLDQGTRRMPSRPFFEFRAIDLEWIRKSMQEYVVKPGFFGRIGAFFGR